MADILREQMAQSQMQSSAVNAMLTNPQFNNAVQKVCQMFGVDINAASTMEKQAIYSVAMMFVNSPIGQMAGMDNGADIFTSIHRGVTANAMPMVAGIGPMVQNANALFGGGVGSGRMPFIGFSNGAGFNSTAVASQLQAVFNRSVYNADGSHNNTFTNGLNPAVVAQVFAKQIEQRGFNHGDVVQANFGNTAAAMEAQINQLVSAGTIVSGGAAHKGMQEVLHARTVADNLVSGGMTMDQALEYMGTKKGGGFSKRVIDDVRAQSRGALRGTILDERVGKEVADSTGRLTENIKALSELTGHMNLDDLQSAADSLRMGSLAQQRNIKQVDARIRQWKVLATTNNRDIREVMLEQQDIAKGLSALYGGSHYVPSEEIENIQQARYLGNKAFERGDSFVTGEVKAEAAARTGLAQRERYKGVLTADYLLRTQGANMTDSERARLKSAIDAFHAGTAAGDSEAMLAASREAMNIARNVRNIAGSADFQKAAIANAEIDVTQSSYRSNALKNTQYHMRRFLRGSSKEANGTWSAIMSASGDDADGSLLSAYAAADALYAGGDTRMRSRIQEMLAKAADGDPSAMQEFINSQESEEAKQNLQQQLNYAMRFRGRGGAKAFRQAASVVSLSANNNVNLANMTGIGTRVDQANARILALNESWDASVNAISQKGLTGFINGLLSNGGLNDKEAALALLSSSGDQTTAGLNKVLGELGGTMLGEMDADGKFKDPKALLQNKQVQAILGIDDSKAAEYAKKMASDPELHSRVMEALNRSGSVGKYNGQLFITEAGAGRKYSEARLKAFEAHRGNDLMSIFGEGAVEWIKQEDGTYAPRVKGSGDIASAMESAWKRGKGGAREAIVKAAESGNQMAKELVGRQREALIAKLNAQGVFEGTDLAKEEDFQDLLKRAQAGDKEALAKVSEAAGSADDFRTVKTAESAGWVKDGKWIKGALKGHEANEETLKKMRKNNADIRSQLDAFSGESGGQDVASKILGLLESLKSGSGSISVRLLD